MRRLRVPIWAVVALVAACDDGPTAELPEPAPTTAEIPPEATRPPTPTPLTPTPLTPNPSTLPPPRATTTSAIAPAAATIAGDGSAGARIVEDDGVSFALPPGWDRTGQVVATEFATGADCVAATIVDFEPPTDPAAEGEAGFRLQSTVQICSRPRDGRTLEDFMDDTYGDGSAFEPVRVGGLDGYRSATGVDSLSFVQTDTRRYQLLTSVAADQELEQVRLAEVADVLNSVAFG